MNTGIGFVLSFVIGLICGGMFVRLKMVFTFIYATEESLRKFLQELYYARQKVHKKNKDKEHE